MTHNPTPFEVLMDCYAAHCGNSPEVIAKAQAEYKALCEIANTAALAVSVGQVVGDSKRGLSEALARLEKVRKQT